MYQNKSVRTFFGTNAERTAAGLGAFLSGDEFYETDTENRYRHDGMQWLQDKIATPGGSDTQLQYNNGGAFGGIPDFIYNDANGRLLFGASSPETTDKLEIHPTAAQDARISFVSDQAVSAANTVGHDYWLKDNNGDLVKFGSISVGSTTTTPGSEYGVFKADVLHNGTMRSVLYLDATSGLSFNEDQQDINILFRSVNAPQLLVLDAGADEVRIGSTTPLEGGVAKFTSSGIVFNDEELDRDFRIAGNGVTNGYFYDAGNNRHGFRTNTPQRLVHILGDDGAVATLPSSLGAKDFFIVENDGNVNISMIAGSSGVSALKYFRDGTAGYVAALNYNHSADLWEFSMNNGSNTPAAIDLATQQFMIGTTTPDAAYTNPNLYIRNDSGLPLLVRRDSSGTPSPYTMHNGNTTDGNGLAFAFGTATSGAGAVGATQMVQLRGVFDTHNHATRSASMQFFTVQNAAGAVRMIVGAGIQVGSPTGGDKGTGTANFAGDIYRNNSAYTNPDYALEWWANDGRITKHATKQGARGYHRLSLNEVERHIKENYRLPGIDDKPMGMFARGDFLLEKVEELFTHIIELNHKLEARHG